MEAEELQLLLKIREGIINGSWEQVIEAWNEISGEELKTPDTRTPAEKLKQQLQEKIFQDDTPKEIKSKKDSGPIDPDTMEESIKDDDIVKIDSSTDDKKEKKNKRDTKRRQSGVPEDMKADSQKGKDKPARFYDSIPDHIVRGSDN